MGSRGRFIRLIEFGGDTRNQLLSVILVATLVLATVIAGVTVSQSPFSEHERTEALDNRNVLSQANNATGEDTLTSGESEALLEIHSTADNDEFTYRFVVEGTVERTQVGPNGVSGDPSDTMNENDNGTVTVTGSTGNSLGDAFLFDGTIISSQVTGSDNFEVFVRKDVTETFGVNPPTQDRHTIEIIPNDSDAEYRVEVSDSIEPAEINGRNLNPRDSIEGNIATGRVAQGYNGDSYRFTGDYNISSLSGNARFLVDGEEVEPNMSEPRIEFINCSAARVSGDFANVAAFVEVNERDGQEGHSHQQWTNSPEIASDGVIHSDRLSAGNSVNGSVLFDVFLLNEETEPLARKENPQKTECYRHIRPQLDFEVRNVESEEVGTYNVTFSYTNHHNESVYFGDQELQGSVRSQSINLPTELEPGTNTFSVQWEPQTNEERLVWVIPTEDWLGYNDSITVETDPASSYEEDDLDMPRVKSSLSVENQTGDGSNLTVSTWAVSNYSIRVSTDRTTLNETSVSANESFSGNLTLDPPIEENTTVRVAIQNATADEESLAENISYNVVPSEPDPTGMVLVDDQAGNGSVLMVTNVTANLDYYVAASYGDEVVESDVFDAEETNRDLPLSLDSPISENTTVKVSVISAANDSELASEEISYTPTLSRDELNERIARLAPTDMEVVETGDAREIQIAGENGDGTVEIHESGSMVYIEGDRSWIVNSTDTELAVQSLPESGEEPATETPSTDEIAESHSAIQSAEESDGTYQLDIDVTESNSAEEEAVVEAQSLGLITFLVDSLWMVWCVNNNLPEDPTVIEIISILINCSENAPFGNFSLTAETMTETPTQEPTTAPTSTETPAEDTLTPTTAPTPDTLTSTPEPDMTESTPTDSPTPTDSSTTTETPEPTDNPPLSSSDETTATETSS